MSDTDSKLDTPVLANTDWETIERFKGRVSSIEIVRSNGPLELRTIIHLSPIGSEELPDLPDEGAA